MLLPADLRQKLSPNSVSSFPPKLRMEVLDLLVELQNLSTRRSLIDWCRHCGFAPAAHQDSERFSRVSESTP